MPTAARIHGPDMLRLRVKKGEESDVRQGSPWLMAHQLIESSELALAGAGELCGIYTMREEFLGIGYYNRASHIACRVLSRSDTPIDAAWFEGKFRAAREKRERWAEAPYYRLVHAEADGLAGLVIDRYGDILSVQVATAGMERLQPVWLEVLDIMFQPQAIVLRGDIPARALEGLSQEVRVVKGEVPEIVEVVENGCIYYANLLKGQKTGWFYDQRDNRALVARHCAGKTMLDVYTHSGGFGVLAAVDGASRVLMADRSEIALGLALKATVRNGVESVCEFLKGDAVACMRELAAQGECFDMVVADPPAFVKARKDVAAGMKGYEKVATAAAALVEKGGMLFMASCSHHATRAGFRAAVLSGVKKAGRTAQILEETGAGRDHPRAQMLPQSEYLKGVLLRLD